jgi:hypothetical protein
MDLPGSRFAAKSQSLGCESAVARLRTCSRSAANLQPLGCEIAANRQPLYITRKAHDYVENILLQHLDSHRPVYRIYNHTVFCY